MELRGPELLKATRREFGRAMGVAAAITVFLTLLQLAVPLYMMQVFDRVLNSRSVETLTMLTAIVLVAVAMYAALDFLRGRVFLMAGHLVSARLNGAAFEAAVIDTMKGDGANASQAIRDISDLRTFITGSAVVAPLELLFVPLFMLALFLLHPSYGVLAVAGAALMFGLSVVNELVTRRPIMEASAAAARSYGSIGAAIRHGEVLEAMGMTAAVTRRWVRSQNRLMAPMIRGTDRGKLVASLSRGARLGLRVALIFLSVILVLDHAASPGSMFGAMFIMAYALQPFEQLIETYRQWVFAHAAYGRLKTLLSRTDGRRQGMALPMPNPQLRVERLVFVPPGHDRAVLKGVSFQLEPGEVLGIVGPSGSGKSTLARLLVGVWEPTSGGVFLDGHNVYTWSRENFGRHVGYLPQSIGLLEGTIRDNIARMAEADPRDVVEAARRADVHELIGRLPFGYESPLDDDSFVLSGGQRQRVALARALFGRPRLIVLDEPNSNLDQAGEAALIAAIRAAKDDGATVVVIAHRPAVLATADKLLALRDGVVERFGPRDEIARFGRLAGPGGEAPPRPITVTTAAARLPSP
ncbi:type I secretion system permease/ATPase [Azospirillum sp. ST 5-10]|uniref:type I secretion system permease/ATPase n=1 Tax=unclassified Azospirillum TaxID=2630922 RepID=UPI003F4A3EDF